MNRETYAIALNNALTEIKKAYPAINHSFIFTSNKSIIARDQETDEKTMENILELLETLKQKTKIIGNLQSLYINAKNGKLIVSNINNVCLVLVTSEKIDKTHIYAITHVILPTILKTMETLTSIPTQVTSPKKLVVDVINGFFVGNSVQIDPETLLELTRKSDPRANVKTAVTGEQNMQEPINYVRIETLGGNSTLCKVKEINDQKLKGKNMIRIPEKICNTLEIEKGDWVKVKPLL